MILCVLSRCQERIRVRNVASRLLLALAPLLLLGCTDGLEPVTFQGVSGTVRFSGNPPDSTEWVRLAVYRDLPASTAGLIGFVAFSDTLPLERGVVSFNLPLDTGAYRWIPAVWKRRDVPLAITSLRVMGWYSDSEDPFAPPVAFRVEAGKETAGIDINADFTRLLSAEEALQALEEGS